jgi:hypothetical protein
VICWAIAFGASDRQRRILDDDRKLATLITIALPQWLSCIAMHTRFSKIKGGSFRLTMRFQPYPCGDAYRGLISGYLIFVFERAHAPGRALLAENGRK